MLNYLWAGMMAAGIFWAAFHGNMAALTDGMLGSVKEAVALCMTMLGIMSFWCGILKIGEKAGLIGELTRKMRPVIRVLFPRLPEDHPAGTYIAANMIAKAGYIIGLKEIGELALMYEYTSFLSQRQLPLVLAGLTSAPQACFYTVRTVPALQFFFSFPFF